MQNLALTFRNQFQCHERIVLGMLFIVMVLVFLQAGWAIDDTVSLEVAKRITFTHIQTDTTGNLYSYHILRIPYALPEYKCVVGLATSGREATSSIAKRTGAVLAVNGGFFEWTGEHVGLTMQSGKIINSTYKMQPSRGSIGFGKHQKIVIDRVSYSDGTITGLNGTDWTDVTDVISAGPVLLRNGEIQPVWVDEELTLGFSTSAHARTAIGYTRDTVIYLVVIDGYQPAISNGISIHNLSKYMKNLGCTDALNLDGGGSSTMVIWNKVVNCVSDEVKPGVPGIERPVTNALLIKRKD
jgi:exopolysaccharide biosynthesis protein